MFGILDPLKLLKMITFNISLGSIFDSPTSGALAGLVVGGPIGAAFGGALGAGQQAAGIQGDIARQQQELAEREFQQQQEVSAQAQAFAEPTFEELQAIQNLLQQQETIIADAQRALDRQQELLSAVDPALQESGRQALALLEGQEAPALDFIRRERETQRRALEQNLSQRLGAGFATSSAGIQALNAFDDQSGRLLFDAQQSTLNSLLNVSLQARPDPLRDIASFQEISQQAQFAPIQLQQNIRAGQISALTQTQPSFQNLLATAGADLTEDLLRAQNLQQLFGAIGGGALQLGGAAIGAGGLGGGGGGGFVGPGSAQAAATGAGTGTVPTVPGQ